MNRKIKFRGFSISSKKWRYGYIWIVLGANLYYILTGKINKDCSIEKYEVYPESIGQYTGVKDKNGKEVYEGDILDDGYEKRIVKFKDGAFYQALLPQDENKNLFEPWLPVMVVIGVLYDVEVIGDIYTTPELLREGE